MKQCPRKAANSREPRAHPLRIKFSPPPPAPEFLSKDFCNQVSNGNSYRGEPGRGRNFSHCRFQDFNSLSKGSQVSLVRIHFSCPESDGKSADVGGAGRIGILILEAHNSQDSSIVAVSSMLLHYRPRGRIGNRHTHTHPILLEDPMTPVFQALQIPPLNGSPQTLVAQTRLDPLPRDRCSNAPVAFNFSGLRKLSLLYPIPTLHKQRGSAREGLSHFNRASGYRALGGYHTRLDLKSEIGRVRATESPSPCHILASTFLDLQDQVLML